MAQRGPLTGAFAGTGVSLAFLASLPEYNLSLYGGSGTVALERSFDSGSTWATVETFAADAERIVDNVEVDTLYRFNCTAFTSGPINYRIGGRSISG